MTTQTDMTADEYFDSLTGFDEIAIAKAFDLEITALAKHKPTIFMRALIFVDRRRAGDDDKAAKEAALSIPLGQVQEYFAEDNEVDPEDPITESGKDSAEPQIEPGVSLSSAS